MINKSEMISFREPKYLGVFIFKIVATIMLGMVIILLFIQDSRVTLGNALMSLLFIVSAVDSARTTFLWRTITVSDNNLKIKYLLLSKKNKTYELSKSTGYFYTQFLSWHKNWGQTLPIIFIGFKNGDIIKLKDMGYGEEIGYGQDYKSKKIGSVIKTLESNNILNLNPSNQPILTRYKAYESNVTKEVRKVFTRNKKGS